MRCSQDVPGVVKSLSTDCLHVQHFAQARVRDSIGGDPKDGAPTVWRCQRNQKAGPPRQETRRSTSVKESKHQFSKILSIPRNYTIDTNCNKTRRI